MAVGGTFDAAVSSATTNGAPATNKSHSHTFGGSNRAVYIWVTSSAGMTGAAVTVGGVSATLVSTYQSNSCALFVLANPASGSQTVAVTGLSSGDIGLHSISASDVDQTTLYHNLGQNFANPGNPTVSPVVETGTFGVAFASSGSGLASPTQTQRGTIQNINGSSASGNSAMQSATGAGSAISFGWGSNGDQQQVVALAVGGTTSLWPTATTAVGTGTRQTTGTTTITPALPTTVKNDAAIAFRFQKPETSTATAETGWTQLGTATGGTGTTGVDTGQTRVTADLKILAGGDSNPTFDQGTSPNSVNAVVETFRKDPECDWDIDFIGSGADSSHGTGRSVTCGTAGHFVPGDIILVGLSSDTDTATAFTSPTITITGCTLSAVTEMLGAGGTGTGNDTGGMVYMATVVSGTATVAPSISLSGGPSNCGPGIFIRIRATLAIRAIQPTIIYGAAVKSTTASMSGSGVLAAAATATAPTTASMSGLGTLAASDIRHEITTASMAGAGTLAASDIRHEITTASLAGTGTLAADGARHRVTTSALQGDGLLEGYGWAWPMRDPFTGGGTLGTALPLPWQPWKTMTGTIDGITISGSNAIVSDELSMCCNFLVGDVSNVEVPCDDQYAEIDVEWDSRTLGNGSGAGIMIRADVTGRSGYSAWYFNDVTLGPTIAFLRYDSGTGTVLGTLHAADGAVHTIGIRAVGSLISLYVDGVATDSATDATYGGTNRYSSIITYAFGSDVITADNFEWGCAVGGNLQSTTASLTGTGTLAATGVKVKATTASMAGAGSLAASQVKHGVTTGSLSGQGALTTDDATAAITSGSMSGAGTLASSVAAFRSTTGAVAGTGTLAAADSATAATTGAITGAGTLSAADSRTATTTGAISGQGDLEADIAGSKSTTAALSGAGTLAASATRHRVGSGSMAGSCSLDANGVRHKITTGDLPGQGTLAATPLKHAVTSGAVVGSGVLVGSFGQVTTAALAGLGSLTAQVLVHRVSDGAITGSGLLDAQAVRHRLTTGDMSGSGALSCLSLRLRSTQGALSGASALLALGLRRTATEGTLSGTGTLGAVVLAAVIRVWDGTQWVAIPGDAVARIYCNGEWIAAPLKVNVDGQWVDVLAV